MSEETFAQKPESGQPWDVAIIGSGPAALTAAIYTTRGAASTLILGGETWGGQLMLTTVVDNFPGFPQGVQGPQLIQAMRSQAERFGTEFKEASVEKLDTTKTPFEITAQGEVFKARAVIVATGASTVWLDAPGVKELIGRGVCSCAPCDAPFFKNKKVAVVGGGDSAMEEALTLTNYASEVTIIHRRDTFRASAAMQQKVLTNPKIKVLWNTEVVSVKGEGKVEALELVNNKTNERTELTIDGLFIAIGHKPETDVFKGTLELDEKGYVLPKEGSKTNVPGVFVAGDVHDIRYRQAITAAAFGSMAAIDTLKYLAEKQG